MARVQVKCDWCKSSFGAKVADRARGWARCCSKRCASIVRERKRKGEGKETHWDRVKRARRRASLRPQVRQGFDLLQALEIKMIQAQAQGLEDADADNDDY